jgi:hypothetical protein
MARFFNHPIVLVLILVACVGFLTYMLWPAGQDELFAQGKKLMQSDRLSDMERAWTDYLEPLQNRFPNHPYQDELAEFRVKLSAARSPHPSEAERFFHQGELQRKQGDIKGAQRTWTSLVDAFGGVESEKEWVQRARNALTETTRSDNRVERFRSLHQAIDHARELRKLGKGADAERIFTGIENLYGNDPAASEILKSMRQEK